MQRWYLVIYTDIFSILDCFTYSELSTGDLPVHQFPPAALPHPTRSESLGSHT